MSGLCGEQRAPRSSPAPSRVLIVAPPGSYRITPFVEAAHRLDAEVLIASSGRHSLVNEVAHGLHVDLGNPTLALKAIEHAARATPFAAVIGTDDVTVELAARAAERLGLAHNPPEAVRTARRKDLARERLRQAGMRVPRFRRIDLEAPLETQAGLVPFPCVLKPLALSASRGVIRADDPASFVAACARIARLLATAAEVEGEERRYLLAEEFIPGVEVAVEGLLTAGQLAILAIFDKPEPLDGPYFEETYYVTPSRLPRAVQAALHATISAACRAYGLREGPIHAECRINDQGVWIIEIAARNIGGMCARLLRFGTGHGLEELTLMHALGRPVRVESEAGGAGVLMIPIPRHGILRRIEGVTAALKVPHVEELHIAVREGYELVPLPEGASYLGFIFARAPTPAQAEQALREAHACLNIVIAPLWKGIVAACVP